MLELWQRRHIHHMFLHFNISLVTVINPFFILCVHKTNSYFQLQAVCKLDVDFSLLSCLFGFSVIKRKQVDTLRLDAIIPQVQVAPVRRYDLVFGVWPKAFQSSAAASKKSHKHAEHMKAHESGAAWRMKYDVLVEKEWIDRKT